MKINKTIAKKEVKEFREWVHLLKLLSPHLSKVVNRKPEFVKTVIPELINKLETAITFNINQHEN